MAPCPFLDADLCSIYAARPNHCRGVTGMDAEVCRQYYLEDSPNVPEMSRDVSDVCRNLDWAVIRAGLELGQASGLYDMPAAVEYLLAHPGETDIPPRFRVITGQSKRRPPLSPEATQMTLDPHFVEVRDAAKIGETEVAYQVRKTLMNPLDLIQRFIVPPVYRSQEEIEMWWSRWGENLLEVERSRMEPRAAWEALTFYEPFFLAYSGKDVRDYSERFMRHVVEHWARPAFPELTAPIEGPRRPGKLRVGFVSSRLKMFNGSRWALGWLRNLGPEFETYAINLDHTEDQVSAIWCRNADHFFHLPVPIAEAAPVIRDFDLDALIFTDIGMDGPSVQLASLRLARLQATAWGHPVTSGSPMIDLYLSSEMMEPEGGQDHYSERLAKLPNSGLTYPRMRPHSSKKSAAELGLPETGFYFVPQLASKLLPSHDWMFREIGRRSGKPIVFIGLPAPYAAHVLEDRLRAADVPAIVLPRQSVEDYVRLMKLADALLDPPAWNGGNTTIEALCVGTPVVSLSGPFMRGRHGRAFLPLARVAGLLTSDEEGYIDLALNLDRMKDVMTGLDVEPLFEDPLPSQALKEILQSG